MKMTRVIIITLFISLITGIISAVASSNDFNTTHVKDQIQVSEYTAEQLESSSNFQDYASNLDIDTDTWGSGGRMGSIIWKVLFDGVIWIPEMSYENEAEGMMASILITLLLMNKAVLLVAVGYPLLRGKTVT